MAPRDNTGEFVCMECSMCSFYWGKSCPGLKMFKREECIEM